MNIFDFLKYWLDTHPIIFAIVVIILSGGISEMFGNLFYNKHKAESHKEESKRFWKS